MVGAERERARGAATGKWEWGERVGVGSFYISSVGFWSGLGYSGGSLWRPVLQRFVAAGRKMGCR